MPWAVIVINLTPALILVWLVFVREWEPWKALLLVAFSAAGIAVALLAVIMVLSGSENRIEIWQVVRNTIQNELDQMLKYFRLRKRK